MRRREDGDRDPELKKCWEGRKRVFPRFVFASPPTRLLFAKSSFLSLLATLFSFFNAPPPSCL